MGSWVLKYAPVDVSAVPVQLSNVRLANCSLDGASPLLFHVELPSEVVSHCSHAMKGNTRMSQIRLVQLDGRRHPVELHIAHHDA